MAKEHANYLAGVTALWSLSKTKHIYPSLVLVQPRKTRPYITERLLMRPKESNQTNKQRCKQEYSIIILQADLLKAVSQINSESGFAHA